MAEGKVEHVVVDSGAFIRNAPIRDIAENVYSLQGVVSEIRDKETRQRLEVLPYQIAFKEPSVENVRQVTEFSKKTGDYPSLSAVDIKVLALTLQLEKQHVGTEHIKTEPEKKPTYFATQKPLERVTDLPGWVVTTKQDKDAKNSTPLISEGQVEDEVVGKDTDKLNILQDGGQTATDEKQDVEITSNKSEVLDCLSEGTADNVSEVEGQLQKLELTIEGNRVEEEDIGEEEEEEDEEEEDDDDDDEGWITPSNIHKLKRNATLGSMETREVKVGCITTDFAMQNVLIQMGLHVISVEGFLIRRAKSYVLRCHACYKVTSEMMREFCPNCGNRTLTKLTCSVDSDGTIRYHFSRRRPLNTRGLIHPLPAPQGGKHAHNPRLHEDQRAPQQRVARKARGKTDVWTEDYFVHSSPFATRDVMSRSAHLGIREGPGYTNFRSRQNPNEVKRHKKRNRKK
ncbi:RNA-binding protein NOB1-like [Branchiostoma floridae]|uniref:RNA-binding protein NOB1 n=1 Tax=Branchiostoma floridae TaxID=7739 RepID=A0A9J7LBJ3_BRAFL|nr:RNA-binding protein NOB1-like [Branchiostoma floridae]